MHPKAPRGLAPAPSPVWRSVDFAPAYSESQRSVTTAVPRFLLFSIQSMSDY